MRKLLRFIALCLLFSGCTAQIKTIENSKIDPDDIPSVVLLYAKIVLTEKQGFLYIGTGVTINNLSDEGKILDYTSDVYPLYDDDRLIALIVETEGFDELYSRGLDSISIDNDEIYMLIRNNGMLVKVSEDSVSVISGYPGIEIDERVVKKVRKSLTNTNDIGKDRKLIKYENDVTDPVTGRKYSSSRLVVKFTDDENDSMISDFEQFCNGKLSSHLKSAGLYVFTIEPSSYRRLGLLIRDAMELDYVKNVSLDEQRDMNPDVKPD